MTSPSRTIKVSDIELVRINPSHAHVLAALHQDGFDSPWTAQAFVDLLSQETVTGWFAGKSEPVGFILIQTAAEESEILTLAVASSHRRCGIARKLVAQALSESRDASVAIFHLEVAEVNTAAIALYQGAGFAPSGRRPNYYSKTGEAVDAILMTKSLCP